MRRLLLLIVVTAWLAPFAAAYGHETRPAFLQMTEKSPGRFEVIFKRPALGGRVLSLAPVLSPACKATTPPVEFVIGGGATRRWTVECGAKGLTGRRLTIDGLEKTLTDALVRIVYRGGGRESVILRSSDPAFTIKGPAGRLHIARDYTLLGIEHILGGIDHLLFVLCLLLLVRGVRPLVKTITAFTVAHSITLGAAVLGLVSVPTAPVEALIALSILLLAAEVLTPKDEDRGIVARWPWIVAFVFGLLHGFGFAGALSEVGLPATDIPLALLAFNVGVELGQLIFVAAALAIIAALRRLSAGDFRWHPQWALPRALLVYAIGGVAAYWTLDRVSGIVAI
jgi:hydrogenase/urease accessory protein HupE